MGGYKDGYRVDATFYDDLHADRMADIEFYRGLVGQSRNAVLELACGTGRVAFALVEESRHVVGIDSSPEMLQYAWRKCAKREAAGFAVPDFVQADMTRLVFDQAFGFCICAFNSFQHLLETDDQLACLEGVRKHLSVAGVFAFDVLNPSFEFLSKRRRGVFKQRFQSLAYGTTVDLFENTRYDRASQVLSVEHIYREAGGEGQELQRAQFTLRQIFPQELAGLLRFAGLNITDKFGAFDGSPFASESEHQIVVCAKA